VYTLARLTSSLDFDDSVEASMSIFRFLELREEDSFMIVLIELSPRDNDVSLCEDDDDVKLPPMGTSGNGFV
jgi:hypothetical protein